MNTRAKLPERLHHIPLNLIEEGDRLRPVNPDRVKEIAASWHLNGQLTPIEVTPADPSGVHQLIAGGHRLAAARQLGEASIAALIVEANADQRRLREIDENLYRAELSPLDQAVFLAARWEIYERLYGETRGRKGKTAESAVFSRGRSFAADVSTRIGLSERSVFVALGRFRGLSDASRRRLRGTAIAENGVELDALCRRTPEQQDVILDMVLPRAGEPKAASIREAWRKLSITEADAADIDEEAQLRRLQKLFEAASDEVKRRFQAWMRKQAKEARQ